MIDWASHRRTHLEPFGWLAAATLAALLAISTTALANWLGGRVGTGTSESTILLDLPPLPPALAVSEPPVPQPASPLQTLEMQDAPDADAGPATPTVAEGTPDLKLPDREALTDLPDAPPQPEALATRPEQPAKQAPRQKAAKVAQKATRQPPAAPSTATAKGDGVIASAMQKWAAKASQRLDRHMRRGSYDAKGQVTIRFQVAASGQITGAKLIGSTGNAQLDAALLAQARRAPALPERPDGQSGQIDKSVTVAP